MARRPFHDGQLFAGDRLVLRRRIGLEHCDQFALILLGSRLVIGLGGAWAFTTLIVSLLYEVAPTDPVVFAAVLGILGTIALVACLLPAWRATRVNAIQVLNTE